MGRFGQNPQASVFADGLIKELETVSEPLRRSSILYALYRLLERRPGRRDEAFSYLDEAAALRPDLPDLAMESWRASHNRSPEKKLAALNALLPNLETPADIVHCRLLSAGILSMVLEQEKKAVQTLNALAPEHKDLKEVILGCALIRKEKNPLSVATDLEQLAALTEDTVYSAALLLEAAALIQGTDSASAEAASLLEQVLDTPSLDWTLLDGVFRIALSISRPEIAAAAVRRLAESALNPPRTADPTKPSGHDFLGFETGNEIAAAYEWLYSVIMRKCTGDSAKALESVIAAERLLPGHPQLKIDRALIMESTGAVEEAYRITLSTDIPSTRKGLMALGAGKTEDVLRIGSDARTGPGGLLGEALMEAAAETPPPPPENAADIVRLAWLEANPTHPSAPKTAEGLAHTTERSPFLALFKEEQHKKNASILSIIDGMPDAPWIHAFTALLGPSLTRADAFLRLADETDDPILKATFIRVGAAFKQADGAPESDIEYLLKKAKAFSLAKDHPEVREDPSEEAWKAAIRTLSSAKNRGDDPTDNRTALYKKAVIQLFALVNPTAAGRAVAALLNKAPADTTALLLDMDAAARRGDWQTVIKRTIALTKTITVDSSMFDLVLGELYLIAAHAYSEALDCFDRAGRSDIPTIADTAALYRLVTLHQMGEKEAIRDAIESVPPPPAEQTPEEQLFSKLFDEPPDPRDIRAMKLLEGYGDDTPQQWIARMAFPVKKGPLSQTDIKLLSKSLHRLSGLAENEESGNSFRVAAALLENRPFETDAAETTSDEYLWYMNTHVPNEDLLGPNERVIALRTERTAPRDDPEWIEWMLIRAESEADRGDLNTALDTLHEALVVAPEHPGLLENQALFSNLAGRYAEAADTHGRLAGFYDSQEEMTHHLAKAALILYDKLNNPEGAVNICREALKRSPEHAEMNEIIAHIMASYAEDTKEAEEMPDEKAPGEEENP